MSPTVSIDELRTIIRSLNDAPLESLLAATEAQVGAAACTVAVLGEWSRGKSSLINALLGRPLLPADIRPTTAGLISIVHGPAEEALLVRADGTTELCPVSSDALASVQTRPTGGTASAARVNLVLPLPVLQGFRLVDTPGVNDLGDLADSVLYELLPRVDLAVVVLDGTNGGMSRSEEDFLQARLLGDFQPPFAVVVGHWDRVYVEDDDEREELVEAFEDATSEVLGADTVLLFGACAGPEASKTAERLWEVLRARAAESRERRKLRLLHQCQASVRARVQALIAVVSSDAEALDTQLATLGQARAHMAPALDDFRAHIRSVGQGPLCQMITRSLRHHRGQAIGDITRRVALAGDVGAYATHGLVADIQSSSRAWTKQHTPEIAAFLQRHLQFVQSEFRTVFGSVLGSELATLRIRVPPSEPLPEVDSEAVLARQQSAESSRYVLPGVLTVLGSLIAAPVGIAGLYVGMHIARQQQREADLALRDELTASAVALVRADQDRIEDELCDAVTDYFSDLDAQLKRTFAGLVSDREDELRHARSLHTEGVAILSSRRESLDAAMDALERA